MSNDWKEIGEQWLEGKNISEWVLGEERIEFHEKQKEFVNAKERYILFAGGFGAGKTLPLIIKCALLALCFPNNSILIGKRTYTGIEKVILPDFFDLIPPEWVSFEKGKGVMHFYNGSEIILMGLDAMQSGTDKDIKKAQQSIKGLNLGAVAIDQLEEIDEDVWNALRGRLRRDVPLHQMMATINPVEHWSYDWFVENPSDNTRLVTASMLDNKSNLPQDYIQDQLNNADDYVRRYVYGEWSRELITEGSVFSKEYIYSHKAEEPDHEWEGARVYREPKSTHEYQIGVDPSEGQQDPAAIVIADTTTGETALTWRDWVPQRVAADKAMLFGWWYNEAHMVPEKNMGSALMDKLSDEYYNIYRQRRFDHREQTQSDRLGFSTNVRTKRILIENMIELLRHGFPKILDERIIEEMKLFVYSDEAKKQGAGAVGNNHDDLIIATMLAFMDVEPKSQSNLSFKQEEPDIIQPYVETYL